MLNVTYALVIGDVVLQDDGIGGATHDDQIVGKYTVITLVIR